MQISAVQFLISQGHRIKYVVFGAPPTSQRTVLAGTTLGCHEQKWIPSQRLEASRVARQIQGNLFLCVDNTTPLKATHRGWGMYLGVKFVRVH